MSRTNRILAGIELADRRIEVRLKHDRFMQALSLAALDVRPASRPEGSHSHIYLLPTVTSRASSSTDTMRCTRKRHTGLKG